jgi:peptide/nickel transport system permease protein
MRALRPRIGSLAARFRPPAWQAGGAENLLGTDHWAATCCRLIFGARVSMVVGFTAVIFAGVVGTVLGIVSGYLGGWSTRSSCASPTRGWPCRR